MHKHSYILIVLITLFSFTGWSQFNDRASYPCAFDEVKRMLHSEIELPLSERYKSIELELNNWLSKNGSNATKQQRYFNNGPDFIIPVVVHVVHNGEPVGTGTNISYQQVKSQVDALNAGFSNYSAAANYYQNLVGAQYAALSNGVNAVDTKIRFCLATIPGSGVSWTSGAEPGVMRYNSALASRHEYSVAGQTMLANLTQPGNIFPSTDFLNIWVLTSIRFGAPSNSGDCPGIEGYASIAGYNGTAARVIEGVVIRSDVFGDNSVNSNNYDLQPIANAACPGGMSTHFANRGKIAVHEVGHFLGLFHTFQDCSSSPLPQCATTGDFICDTNPCDQPGAGTGCAPSDMPENFMYYSDDNVLNTFTAGQVNRMRAMLNTVRASLVSEENVMTSGVLGANGCFAPTVMADFTMPNIFCVSNPATFTNVNSSSGSNLANQWQWVVTPNTGVTIASSNAFSTDITFTNSGNYTVRLTASNSGSQVTSFQRVVTVIACGLEACRKNQVHWKFGWGYIGVDFSNGIPVADPPSSNLITSDGNQESYITESDPETGSLLFYSNGLNVYNAAHNRINAVPLHPVPGGAFNSNGQILSIPFPWHSRQYLLVIPNRGWDDPPVTGVPPNYLPASIFVVNMNGTGSVTPFACNLNLTAPPGETVNFNSNSYNEQITAVPHANGRDYWIIFPVRTNTNKVYLASFLVNAGGITQGSITLMENSGLLLPYGTGIAANKAHNRIAFKYTNTSYQVYLCHTSFDNNRGTFGTPGVLNIEQYGIPNAGGIIFYDDNQIYLSRTTGSTGLLDIDLVTGTATSFSSGNNYGRFSTGPDGNVYAISKPVFSGPASVALARIDRLAGIPTVTTVLTGSELSPSLMNPLGANFWNLPNNIHCPGVTVPVDFTATRTVCNTFQFAVNDSSQFREYTAKWNFGDGSPAIITAPGQPPIHNYPGPGNYLASLQLEITGCAGTTLIPVNPVIHTISVIDANAALPVTGSTTVCAGNNVPSVQYSTVFSPSASYNWTLTGGGQILAPSAGQGINTIEVLFGNTPGPRQIHVSMTEGNCIVNGDIIVDVRLPGPSNAGFDGSISICSSQSSPVNLFSVITGEQPGGIWSRVSGTGGTFNAAAATFTAGPGTTNSTFRYIIPSTGCSTGDTSAALINISNSSSAGLDGNLAVCQINGQLINLFSVISGEQTGGYWLRTGGTGGVFHAAAGTFAITGVTTNSVFLYVLTATNGCVNDTSQAIVQISLPASAGTDSSISVCGNTEIDINLYDLITGEEPGGTWSRISGSNGILNTATGVFVPGSTPGINSFQYIVTGVLPCGNDSSVVNVSIVNSIALPDKIIQLCYGETLDLTGLYNTAGLTILQNWTLHGTLLPDPTSIQSPGIYKIILGTGNGCTDTVSVTVNIHPRIRAVAAGDTIAVMGLPLQLNGSGGNVYTWSWSPLNAHVSNPYIPNPVVTLTDYEYMFYLDVTDAYGCKAADTMLIKVFKGPAYYMPTAFTPNGDGLNDKFTPLEAGIVGTDWFRIFNRYGQVIFETGRQHTGWDGTFKNKPQDLGTYTWMIKGKGYNGKIIEMKGTVLLIR